MPLFRLLHASDFHLAAKPWSLSGWPGKLLGKHARLRFLKSHDDTILAAFTRFVYAVQAAARKDSPQAPAFDAVVLTGDLSTSGYRKDLDRARRFLVNPTVQRYRDAQGDPTLEFARKWVEVVPGNHDRYRRRAGIYSPGGTLFDGIFAGFWSAGQGGQSFRLVRRGQHVLLLLGADFTLHRGDRGRRYWGIPGWYGQGRVNPQPLQDLLLLTQRWRSFFHTQNLPGPIILWVIHFDPFSTDATLELLESDQLARAAKAERIPAILCGHTHESKIKPLSGTTTIYVCGSTSESHSPQGNDFQVLEIDAPDDRTAVPTLRVEWFRYDGKRRFRKMHQQVRVL